MARLDSKYMDVLASLNDGESIRTWHCKPLGSKNNDAFVITRISDNFKYYCHHCGYSGIHSTLRKSFRRMSETTKTDEKREKQLPRDCNKNISDWSSKVRIWLYKYGLTDKEIKDYDISYSAYFNRIIIPMFDGGILLGYQARSVDGETPKWLTISNSPTLCFHRFDYPNSNTVIIVEDIISCILVGRHYNTIAILGTNLKDSVLSILVNRFNKFIVWLDDDNRIVKMKERKIRDKLACFGETRLITGLGKDPKEFSDTEIKDIIG